MEKENYKNALLWSTQYCWLKLLGFMKHFYGLITFYSILANAYIDPFYRVREYVVL